MKGGGDSRRGARGPGGCDGPLRAAAIYRSARRTPRMRAGLIFRHLRRTGCAAAFAFRRPAFPDPPVEQARPGRWLRAREPDSDGRGQADGNGCRGYMEWGFLSTTSHRATAVEVRRLLLAIRGAGGAGGAGGVGARVLESGALWGIQAARR